MDYKKMKPGLQRRLAYSESLKRRKQQRSIEIYITDLETRQRNFLSLGTYEDLSLLEDVVISSNINTNSIFHIARTLSFCNICQEDILIGKLCRTTYCGHMYHFSCIETHCDTSNKCPTCRREFI